MTPMACHGDAASISTGPIAPPYWFMPNTMMHQLGANLIDEDNYKATIEAPAARKVIHYFLDWVNKYQPRRPAIHRQPAPTSSAASSPPTAASASGEFRRCATRRSTTPSGPLPRFAGRPCGRRLRRLCLLHDGQRALVAGGAEGGMGVRADVHRPRGRAVQGRRAVRAAPGRGHRQRRRQEQSGSS